MNGAVGIDARNVERWFLEHVAGARPPLAFERIAGGRSNLTYRVDDGDGATWVMRRPPLGESLGSAHDMAREHRIISALDGTEVPVPAAVGFCDDHGVTGADFSVMELVDGVVLRDEESVGASFSEPERRRIGDELIDTLVALHAVDPDRVGLGELGRKDAYVERQLRRWKRQWDDSKTRELPAMDETHAVLSTHVPEQQGVSIVHGDFRLDNVILSPAGKIAAVVDWELCTLGDPLADLGLLTVYWAEPGDEVVPLTQAPTLAPGFPSRVDLAERYAQRSGRDLSQLDFYVALGYWKLAAILEGVHARNTAGAYGDAGSERFAVMVEQLAEAAATRAATLR